MQLMKGDCLELMRQIPDGSVDMVLCDLPYGTTACKWDSIIPLGLLWEQYRRITKKRGAIVLTASQPFTSALVMSATDLFKYCWVWEKTRATGHVHAKNKPMKSHEDVCVFSAGTTVHASQSVIRMTYNPQGITEIERESYRPSRGVSGSDVTCSLRPSHKQTIRQTATGYPRTVQRFSSEHNVGAFHPTQKPVALMEYLIRTYTHEGMTVLDNCAWSFTTGVACVNLGRRFIGIEKDEKYFDIGVNRMKERIECLDLKIELEIFMGD